MTTRTKLFPYPEQRVLEDAAFARGTTPTRIFALLFPVWCVTITSTVTEAEDYDLIDRYLERGIAEGGLVTTAGLARFYALDEVIVDRALRALAAIGHVTWSDGVWSLTPLGLRSTREQKRYVLKAEDRRKLYFDGWESQPLTRPHYDSRKVTLAPIDAGFGSFQALYTARGFDPGALPRLASSPDRDRFNLPAQIDNPRLACAPEQLFLPVYVIRALDGRRLRYLVYSQASDEADPDLTALAERTPEIAGVLETEARSAQDDEQRARDWLRRNDLDDYRLSRTAGGMLRVTLPGAAFGGDKGVALYRLGSFVLQNTGFFQVWCQDEQVRGRALLERLDYFVTARSQVSRDQIESRLARLRTQLGFPGLTAGDAAAMAEQAGNRRLANRLKG